MRDGAGWRHRSCTAADNEGHGLKEMADSTSGRRLGTRQRRRTSSGCRGAWRAVRGDAGDDEDSGHVPVFFDTPPLTITLTRVVHTYTHYISSTNDNTIQSDSLVVAGAGVFAVLLRSRLPCRSRFLLLCLLWFSCLGFFAMVGVLRCVPPQLSDLRRIINNDQIHPEITLRVPSPPWPAQGSLRSTFSFALCEISHMQWVRALACSQHLHQ